MQRNTIAASTKTPNIEPVNFDQDFQPFIQFCPSLEKQGMRLGKGFLCTLLLEFKKSKEI